MDEQPVVFNTKKHSDSRIIHNHIDAIYALTKELLNQIRSLDMDPGVHYEVLNFLGELHGRIKDRKEED